MGPRSTLRRTGNWILTFLFILGLVAFANLAWGHYLAEGMGLNTWIYVFAVLGAVSLAIRYGRAALHGSSSGAPDAEL